MSKGITYVGLDVHQDTIVAAVLLPRRRQAEIFKCRNEDAAVRRFVRKLKDRAPGRVETCYEAGPTGFHLARLLDKCGIGCVVIAPSLIPSKPGDRVKTDRRDAEKLAKLLRGQLLTEVHPPTEAGHRPVGDGPHLLPNLVNSRSRRDPQVPANQAGKLGCAT